MSVYQWSQTAGSNATADASINWAEGQAPSSVNDSARAMMAALAKYRDDIAGAIVTSGTSTAYTVSSYSGFDTLGHLSGQAIAFTPHTTNGATVTLNVDSLGAKPLRWAPSVELQSGVLVQGTPYVAVYNNSDGAFYLQGNGAGAPGIPLGAGMDYWGTTTPSTAFAFPIGQAISRTTYATAFALMGTTYGTGDGSTTFNLPDRRGRASAQLDPTGTILTSATMSPNGNSLGATGGAQSHSNTVGEMAQHSHGITDPGHNHEMIASQSGGVSGWIIGSNGSGVTFGANNNVASNTTGITINNAGSGTPYSILQPTIACNYIIRII